MAKVETKATKVEKPVAKVEKPVAKPVAKKVEAPVSETPGIDLLKMFREFQLTVTGIEADVVKHTEKGNVQAGARFRKTMLNMKKQLTEMRKVSLTVPAKKQQGK